MCMQDYLLSRLAYSNQRRVTVPLANSVQLMKPSQSRIAVIIPTLPNAIDFTITPGNDLAVAGFRIAAGVAPITFHYQHHGDLPRYEWFARSQVADSVIEIFEINLDIPTEMLQHLSKRMEGGYHD